MEASGANSPCGEGATGITRIGPRKVAIERITAAAA